MVQGFLSEYYPSIPPIYLIVSAASVYPEQYYVRQGVVNNFCDEQIQISILFAKDIFYEYEYEYYSGIILTNICKYSNIFEY